MLALDFELMLLNGREKKTKKKGTRPATSLLAVVSVVNAN
jgi:hypothetical protein